MDFKPITFTGEYIEKYWLGPTNIFARYFTYFQRCLTLVNDAKYILALFGLGVFKSDLIIPTWVLILGGLIALPLMILIGRWHLFRVQKATEYINAQHGTVTGYQSFNMQVETVRLLTEILNRLPPKEANIEKDLP